MNVSVVRSLPWWQLLTNPESLWHTQNLSFGLLRVRRQLMSWFFNTFKFLICVSDWHRYQLQPEVSQSHWNLLVKREMLTNLPSFAKMASVLSRDVSLVSIPLISLLLLPFPYFPSPLLPYLFSLSTSSPSFSSSWSRALLFCVKGLRSLCAWGKTLPIRLW